jgi:hypothetical protein
MFEYLKNGKHQFHPLSEAEINDVDNVLPIPPELKQFYRRIGYGFFHTANVNAFNRFMDPVAMHDINLRKDVYEFDPNLDFYAELYAGSKLLFFEIDELNHLAIDKESIDGKHAIYHFRDQIAGSLEEFLLAFDKDEHYFDKKD